VLADRVIEGFVLRRRRSASSNLRRRGPELGLDMNGDYVLPGLIDCIPTISSAYPAGPKVRLGHDVGDPRL